MQMPSNSYGRCESLNLSSVLVLYEVLRQKTFLI